MPLTLTTLVPRLPPAIDGVGDYATHVAEAMARHYGIATRFVVGDPAWVGSGTEGQAIPYRSAKALLTYLPNQPGTTVLLHYVPHGYARKACPFWLVQALRQWRQSTPKAHLLTIFHELYACDWQRPWSSDFWLSPVQRNLAAAVAHLSDGAFTTSQRYAQQLGFLSRSKHHQVPTLPVFSNVGEPATIPSWADRQQRLVIFGQRHSKCRIYRESLPLLEQVCRTLNIQGIWDIGPPSGLGAGSIGGVPIHELGALSVEQISHYLSQARAGFLTYDPNRLSKSGIFAAYCAHGLLPINYRGTFYPVDGLTPGIQYWVPAQASLPVDFKAIAEAAHCWYQTHTLTKQVMTLHCHLPNNL